MGSVTASNALLAHHLVHHPRKADGVSTVVCNNEVERPTPSAGIPPVWADQPGGSELHGCSDCRACIDPAVTPDLLGKLTYVSKSARRRVPRASRSNAHEDNVLV